MHELGIMSEVIKTISNIADEQNIEKVDTIVLEVGELCGMIPKYIDDCFPAVTFNKPRFVQTKLKMDIVPGEAKCTKCGMTFNIIKNEGYCPKCKSFDKKVFSGTEFMIKEIRVKDDGESEKNEACEKSEIAEKV